MNIKKLTSLIFNRTVLIAALIVFQAALLLVSMVFFSAFFVYFYWNCVILSILAVLIIVSRQTDPGYKIAWIIPILIFPVFGWLVYLLRYLRWIALGWCAALLVRMAFLLSAGRKARIAVGAVALVFLALAAAIILCVRYAAVESRTLSLIVYYLMMNNWLFILPGAALGFAVSFRPPLGD